MTTQMTNPMAGTAPATRTWPRRMTTIAVAAAAALAAWTLVDPVGGLELAVRSGDDVQRIGPAAVLAAVVIPGLLSWAVVAVLERRTARPRRIWTMNASIALLLSLLGPLTSGDGADSKLVLCGFHLLVAAVLVPGFRSTLR